MRVVVGHENFRYGESDGRRENSKGLLLEQKCPKRKQNALTDSDHLRQSMRLLQRERTSSRGSERDAGELTGETLTSLVDV